MLLLGITYPTIPLFHENPFPPKIAKNDQKYQGLTNNYISTLQLFLGVNTLTAFRISLSPNYFQIQH
jgi:hypothetical protein